MSVAEAHEAEAPPAKPIFGPIDADQMAADPKLARHVLSVVSDACRHSKGKLNVVTVAQGLRDGSMLLYGVLTPPSDLEAAVVARPRDGVFEVLIAGPKFEDVAPFLDDLEKYARGARCERMAMWGPPFFREKGFLPPGWFQSRAFYERLIGATG